MPSLAAMERDLAAERYAVDPCRLPIPIVIASLRPPELCRDLLDDILAIALVPAVGIGDLVDQPGVSPDQVAEPSVVHGRDIIRSEGGLDHSRRGSRLDRREAASGAIL